MMGRIMDRSSKHDKYIHLELRQSTGKVQKFMIFFSVANWFKLYFSLYIHIPIFTEYNSLIHMEAMT